MFYYIKITSETGKIIEIDGRDKEKIQDALESLEIFIDTVDENVNNRASNIINRINIKLKLNEATNSICKDFMDWALESSGEDVYRLVHIDVYDTLPQVIRSFDIQKVFVEDYKESFIGREVTTAELKLIQQSNNSKNFLHDTARL